MAEMDRDLWDPIDPDGKPLPDSCAKIMGLLWTYVETPEALRYRKERGQKTRHAPRVPRWRLREVRALCRLNVDTFNRRMGQLSDAGYVITCPRDSQQLALLDSGHREAYLASERAKRSPAVNHNHDTSAEAISDEKSGSDDFSSGAISDEKSGSHGQKVGIARTESREIPTFDPTHPLEVPGSQLGPVCGSPTRALADASTPENFLQRALEILQRVDPPLGAARLPASNRSAGFLVALFQDGNDPDDVEAVLQAVPAMVAAGVPGARVEFYVIESFQPGPRWSRWRNAFATFTAAQRKTSTASTAAPAAPPAADPAELERQEQRELLELVERVKSPPMPTEHHRLGWRAMPAVSRAIMFAPDAATAAAATVVERARAQGRDPRLDEFRAALSSIEVTEEMVQKTAVPQASARPLGACLAAVLDRRPEGRREEPDEHEWLMRRRAEQRAQVEQLLAERSSKFVAEDRG